MHPDAEHALAHQPLLEQAGEVGADALVRRDGVLRARFYQLRAGHGCYMLRYGGKTDQGVLAALAGVTDALICGLHGSRPCSKGWATTSPKPTMAAKRGPTCSSATSRSSFPTGRCQKSMGRSSVAACARARPTAIPTFS